LNIPIDQFENWLRNKNLKDRSIKEYMYYFNKFLIYGPFTQESVSKFLSEKSNRNVIARSFLINLQKFLFVNYKELGIEREKRMDISEVELPKLSGRTKQILIKPLMEEQVLEIVNHMPSEKTKLMTLLTYYGGLRVGGLMSIQINSFNWNEWKKDMTDQGECVVREKGQKERIAFIPPKIMKRSAQYIRSNNWQSFSAYLFMPDVKNINDVNINSKAYDWATKLRRAGIKAGVSEIDSNGKIIKETGVHPHKLRHSWGYHLKNVKKLDIRDIQEILGHSSIVSTQRYLYTDKDHIKKLLKDHSSSS